MDEVISKMTVIVGKRSNRQLWYNEDCEKCKTELNVAKKDVQTQEYTKIRETEVKYNKCEVAKEEWIQGV